MPQENNPIKSLQDAIAGQAKEQPVPERFIAENFGESAIIIDTKTSRCTEVPLHAFSSVRKALMDLFPDERR